MNIFNFKFLLLYFLFTLVVLIPKQTLYAEQNALDNLVNNFEESDEVLEPDIAFQFNYIIEGQGFIDLSWVIADNHYLYKDKFSFKLLEGDATFYPAMTPASDFVNDILTGGVTKVYFNTVDINLPIELKSEKAKIEVKYQGCSKKGICYPPIKKVLNLSLIQFGELDVDLYQGKYKIFSQQQVNLEKQALIKFNQTKLNNKETGKDSKDNEIATEITIENLSESEQITQLLNDSNFILTLAIFFLFGLLLAFTPCVFPMIPILSSIIVKGGKNLSAYKGFILSLVYVLSVSFTYAIAGVFAGLFGENLQALLQNPIALYSFAVIFVLLALSMFGFYEIQLPQFLQTKVTTLSNKQKGNSYFGVAIMGVLSALIVGPCVAPPLVGALIYIGQTGDAVLGGLALFTLSLGMGLPLLLIGTFFGKYLPKTGPWMNIIKQIFGVLLLAVAIFILDRVLPPAIVIILWAGLGITSSVYMGAFQFTKDKTNWQKLIQGLGLIIFIYSVILLIGFAKGNYSVFYPLKIEGSFNNSKVKTAEVKFERIKTLSDLENKFEIAKQQNKKVILDFYADWCVSCKEMEAFTFSDYDISSRMSKAILLQADVTANDLDNKELMKAFNIFGPPAILFFSAEGKELRSLRTVGFKNVNDFSKILSRAGL